MPPRGWALALFAVGCSGPAADAPCSTSTFYADLDGDGHGDAAQSTTACRPPHAYVSTSDDCDDANSLAHPDQVETCNGVDDDCDGAVDPLCVETIVRVSVASDGSQADEVGLDVGYGKDRGSYAAAISGDGRYVGFVSAASNLDTAAAADGADAFRHDVQTGATALIGVPAGEGGSPSSKSAPQIAFSGDGSRAAFYSSVSLDGTHGQGVWYRDLPDGVSTALVDPKASDTFTSLAVEPVLSSDGSRVLVRVTMSDLTSGCAAYGVAVVDLASGTWTRPAAEADYACNGDYVLQADLSPDGRTACWVRSSVALDTGVHRQFVEVWDIASDSVSVVSDAPTGEAAGSAWECALSTDGSRVAFTSDATNLVSAAALGTEVYVRDRGTGSIERVSVSDGGPDASGGAYGPSISGDGNYVSFVSDARLVAEDNGVHPDVYVRDRAAGTTKRVSVAMTGDDASGKSNQAVLSDDGAWIAFTSEANDLVPGDTDGFEDVFLAPRP